MENEPVLSHRPIAEDELSAIAAIEKRVHRQPWSQDQFQAELDKPYSHIWVLTDDETDQVLTGYIVFWELGETIELLNVAVDLPYRGIGLGERLVRAMIQHGLRTDRLQVLLEVRVSNQSAIRLYQKCGFEILQTRKSFYSDGEDAYQMKLTLSTWGGTA